MKLRWTCPRWGDARALRRASVTTNNGDCATSQQGLDEIAQARYATACPQSKDSGINLPQAARKQPTAQQVLPVGHVIVVSETRVCPGLQKPFPWSLMLLE